MTNNKTVTLTLAPVSLVVTGNNDKEILANAKIAFAEQLTQGNFPKLTYVISDGDVLTIDTAFPGLIVESDDGKLGICTAVNKKTIHVTYVNHISVAGPPYLFKASTATFEQAKSKREDNYKKINFWTEGYSGFIKTTEGIREVVIGKMTRGKAKLHIINTKKSISLTEADLSKHLKDDKAEL